MRIEELSKQYASRPQISALAKTIKDGRERHIVLDGLTASSAPLLFSSLAKRCQCTVLFILQDVEDAGYFYHDLTQLMGESRVLFFPSSYKRSVKYGQLDPANEILRTEVLAEINAHSALYIVSYPEAVAEKVVTKDGLEGQTLSLAVGQDIDTDTILQTLSDLGFTEVDYVYEPGQFALRGSILDVYSYSCEFPYRIDFFGDVIESIRTFEVEDQLSKATCGRADIIPDLKSQPTQRESLLRFLPEDSVLCLKNFDYVAQCIEQVFQEGMPQESGQECQLIGGAQFCEESGRFRMIELRREPKTKGDAAVYYFNIKPQPLFHKNFDLLARTLEERLQLGYKLFILADSRKQQERLREILSEKVQVNGKELFIPVDRTLHEGFIDDDVRACFLTDHQIFDRFHKYSLKSDKARTGKVALTLKEIQQFEIGDYVVHLDHGIGKFGGLLRMPLPDGGGYQEMIKITYQRGDSIYVSIHSLYKVSKYKSQEGSESPRLSTLGTGQWERMKERTKKHIKDIARDLIRLYAKRSKVKGFAYSHDSYMQQELEASFLYEDTPDQLKATQEVKADMERPQPMDRLVCGDVGFGKTEVAIRAAFKAACDGKQVAVMVPTTVLAYQHFHTFSNRLKDMPVRVDYLTRARSTKQTTALLKDLEDGKIDIIIGTHKLIGKNVKFRDLGLLIIDEEQKLGVATKEKLRQMKSSVDTLTMSATPIPRTLQFSLVGARDLSVIQTPPPNRYPIQTEIHVFSADIIAEAINFEMSRNGQVFFVNNRISDLQHIEELIHRHVPEARVAVGHGQMKPEDLEQIILDFSNYEYDVLLSTTIIENGIDIPNANTIIINSAHYFGLSDLHQMRGRVGRGNRKAFCYLLAPPLSVLPVDSRRRLEALENFSDLGSGINIAMQDLDIRGAGNLLGSEQSGFISDLGYETYKKILNEAMAELKSEELKVKSERLRVGASAGMEFASAIPSAEETPEGNFSLFTLHSSLWVSDCTIESDLELLFPDQYVPSDSERMLLYRELDNLRDDRELEAYRSRLIDRFGPIPNVAEELIKIVPLRRLGKMLGCEKIMLKQQRMFLFFVSNTDSPYYQSDVFGRVIDFVGQNVRRCNLREQNGKRSLVITGVPTVDEAVSVLRSI